MSDHKRKISNLKVTNSDLNIRLDIFLSSNIHDYSRSYFQKLIKNGCISLNGNICKVPKVTVSINDEVTVNWPEEKNFEIPKGEEFSFKILFEDADLIVIDKPPGVVVHPAAGNWEGTVVNALLGRDERFIEKFANDLDSSNMQRPGIVHRLDKDTSGCLVIAKNSLSRHRLSESFATRKVKKTYFALTYGKPKLDSGEICNLIGRHPVNRKKMAVVLKNGKEAVTRYEVLKTGEIEGEPVSLLKVNILTGRTHQIRVHMAYIKLPILGDSVYGGRQKLNVSRQMLHAGNISFPHPGSGENILISSPYPKDFQHFLNLL